MKYFFRCVLGGLGIFMVIGDAIGIILGKQLSYFPFLPSIAIFTILLMQYKLENMDSRKG